MSAVAANKKQQLISSALSDLSLMISSTFQHHEKIYWISFGILGALLIVTRWIIVPVLLQMLLYTCPILYIGAHLSLQQKDINPETGEKQLKSEAMSRKDAILFPIIGSATLMTLYLAYKFLPIYWVNMLLSSYLTFFGCVALGETTTSVLDKLCPPSYNVIIFDKKYEIPGQLGLWTGPLEIQFSKSRLLGHLVSVLISAGWLITRSWTLHNLFAMAFCMQGIRLVSVGSFKIASILLVGLFVYDIFWVFATDVMVTVAKSFEAPAKFIFPVSFDPWKQSILGLGDIVIPGVFIAMVLRFDHNIHELKNSKKTGAVTSNIDIHQHFNKFYFWCNIFAYEVGLLTTGIMMLWFKHPQPALLYLVPYCLAGLFLPAVVCGHAVDVWNYTEEDEHTKTD